MEIPLLKINLFSTEGRENLRNVVRLLDIRNGRFEFDSDFVETSTNCPPSLLPDEPISFRLGCNVCDFECDSVVQQKTHFQSEWHLFNLRRRLKSKSTITENTFEQILSGERRSISRDEDASGSSSSSESDDEMDEQCSKPTTAVGSRGGAVFFLTKTNKVISCYRSVLTPLRSYQVDHANLLANLRRLHSEDNVWIILVLAGGHFAGAVFDNNRSDEAVVHKTFHRYTVRAKQGGAQSKKDAQGGKIKSAGAMLRRYNEDALCKDVRNLLTVWSDYARRASAIFLRCSLRHRYIFYAGEEPSFFKNDQRIRNIPFVTKNPTYEETKRIYSELASMDVYDSESFMALYQSESIDQNQESIKAPKKEASPKRALKSSPQRKIDGQRNEKIQTKTSSDKISPQSAPDVGLPQDLRQRLYTACKRGDATSVQAIVDEQTSSIDLIRNYLETVINDKESSTFLHLASASGHLDLVRFLLDFGCDPTKRNASNQVPFQVSNGKPTRNVFVQFRDRHPGRWNWNAAQIPEPVDPEMEAASKAKAAERRKAASKAKAERLKEKKEADARARVEEAERLRFLQLSDREKRALAAERRWTQTVEQTGADEKLVLSRCFRCGVDITGKVPFEYSDNRFCSTKCVKESRLANF